MPQKLFMQIHSTRNQSTYETITGRGVTASKPAQPFRGLDLRSPMVGRIYTAKPGCSACGK